MTLSASCGFSTALCELCMRERDGLPRPSMNDYVPQDNLPFRVAQMMGDEAGMAAYARPLQVVIQVPEGILSRVISKIKQIRLQKPSVDNTVPGESAKQIAKSRRNEPLF